MHRRIIAVAVLSIGSVAFAQDPERGQAERPNKPFVGVDYKYAWFHGDIDPWQLASLSAGRRGNSGTFIGRVNYANRFKTDAVQFEAEAYPRVSRTIYAYLNAGYSESGIFPRWRSGAELFANLPRAWETSAGYRQLRFGGPPVTLLTASVGKYVGNSWFSARPYVRVRGDGTTASLGLTARRYFADADNFVGARVSAGNSPSERVDPTELARTNAWSAALHGSRTLRAKFTGTWSAGVEHEKLTSVTTRRRVDLALGLRRDF